MDKMREDFEGWVTDSGSHPRASTRGDNGDYLLMSTFRAWEVWQASRNAIVITAPPFVTSRAALERGYTVDYSNGHGDAMDSYELVLKEAGITIKGEE